MSMKPFLPVLWFLLLLPSLAVPLSAQKTAFGRNFIFSVLQATDENYESRISINLSTVDRSQLGQATISFSALAETSTVIFDSNIIGYGISWPATTLMGLEEGKDRGIISITSEIDVMVTVGVSYTGHPRNHADGTLVFPIETLGTEYYVMSHNETSTGFNSQAVVVATQDDTFVDIIPSVDTRAINAGERFTVELDRGERYQIQSQKDLTGTYIGVNTELTSDCAPISVFAGTNRSTVGSQTYPGYMYKQMNPLSTWGRSYSILPFEQDDNPYLLKVLAFEDGTTVSVNGVEEASLAAGAFMERIYDRPIAVHANKPVQVAQYFMGLPNQTNAIDPFMLMPAANEHFARREFDFIPPGVIIDQSGSNLGRQFQSIIMRTEDLASFRHSSGNFNAQLRTFPPDPRFSYSSFYTNGSWFDVANNADYLLNNFIFSREQNEINLGFITNSGFADLDTLSIEISPLAASTDTAACLNELLNFQPFFTGKDSPRPKYDTFEWDFGDGKTAMGDSVFHQYDSPGEYTVWLRASNPNSLCATEEITSRQLVMVDVGISQVVGPISVCPNVEGVTYRAEGNPQNTYSWVISGGRLRTNTGQEVIVDWEGTNSSAFIGVVSENALGCRTDTLRLPVVINRQLEPPVPNGVEEVCFDARTGLRYEVPFTTGSIYDWRITGGRIVSGQGSNSIMVDWDSPADTPLTGTLSFTESTTTQTDVCAGDSPELVVSILPDLTFDFDLNPVSCPGGADGTIEISPRGGKAPYTVNWPGGATGAILDGLSEGSYRVSVVDGAGCAHEEVLIMTDPDEITADISIRNVSCHDGNDGMVTLSVRGGTAPYRISWDGGPLTQGLTSPGFRAGSYEALVIDDRGCEQAFTFTITQPDPLMAVSTDAPTCPGQSTGTIFVEASGGTSPYFYRWNTSPPQDVQFISGLPAGTYSVTVTDANGCTFTFNDEEIEERSPRIFLPNAFSPNGDGENDTFNAIFDCAVSFEMKVFSQWGDLVFYSNEVSQGWDGTVNGEEAPMGRYSYVVAYTIDANGRTINESVRGTVRIFR